MRECGGVDGNASLQQNCGSLINKSSSVKPLAQSVSLVFQVSICYGDFLIYIVCSGDSAYAVPHTNKLRTRVTHIWGNRRRQLNRSAMEEPLPGRTALLIMVSPVPGKYDLAKVL